LFEVERPSYARRMRARNLVWTISVAGFVGIVVEAAATNQCPASQLGACARIHLEIMRPRTAPPPISPVSSIMATVPMRADARRG
jgi:hypothetical protein